MKNFLSNMSHDKNKTTDLANVMNVSCGHQFFTIVKELTFDLRGYVSIRNYDLRYITTCIFPRQK